MVIDDVEGQVEPVADAPDQPDELSLARELVLRAHPQTVAELVTGNSLAELLASVPAAEAAFARIVAVTRKQAIERPATSPVPGGGAVRSTSVSVEGLSPLAKIRAGLERA